MDKIDKLNPSDLVFCDEMGVDNNICILHVWSEIGKRSYGKVAGFRSERRSIVAGHIPKTKALVAPIEYKGFMDTPYSITGLSDIFVLHYVKDNM